MEQPVDSIVDHRQRKRPRRILRLIDIAAVGFLLLAACCVIPYMLFDVLTDGVFSDSVVHERMGWRFEGRYEGIGGTVTTFSNLTYHGSKIGKSLPDDVKLVIPIGEFHSGQHGWEAVWSEPQIWDDAYRLPEVKDEEPWVTQVEHNLNTEEFLSRGFYQAPEIVRRYGVPWKDRQLKGTPADWVYVYRLSWRDRQNDDYESHAVTGYWVDPVHLDDLKWE